MWLLPATPKYENQASVAVYNAARNAVNIMRSSQEIHIVKNQEINNPKQRNASKQQTSCKIKKRDNVFQPLLHQRRYPNFKLKSECLYFIKVRKKILSALWQLLVPAKSEFMAQLKLHSFSATHLLLMSIIMPKQFIMFYIWKSCSVSTILPFVPSLSKNLGSIISFFLLLPFHENSADNCETKYRACTQSQITIKSSEN